MLYIGDIARSVIWSHIRLIIICLLQLRSVLLFSRICKTVRANFILASSFVSLSLEHLCFLFQTVLP